MSVCYGFTVEIYGFMHSLCTFWHMLLMMPSRDGMEIEVEDLEDRRQRQNEYGRWLTAQQKDERQDNCDKKRLAHHTRAIYFGWPTTVTVLMHVAPPNVVHISTLFSLIPPRVSLVTTIW